MKTVWPIWDKKHIELDKMYLKNNNIKDYLMFVMGINFILRLGDLLRLKVSDVWDGRRCKEYI
jgi:integrase